MSITLPPLPEPTMTWTLRRDSAGTAYYTADQLRADRLAVAQAVLEACAEIAATPFSGEQDDITMAAKDRIADAIRALQIEVNDANV